MATNKTEFQRYLNENPEDCPTLRKLAAHYAENPHGKHTFGFWLRVKHRPIFDRAYRQFWLRSPKLHGLVYDSPEPQI